jgi:hypothetical protein
MRRITFLVSLAGIFVMTLGSSLSWAGEADVLMKKLVEKGVLTDSEAQSLSKEMQKEGKRQESQIELPKGLRGIKLGGTYFLEYYEQDYEDNAIGDKNIDSFRVQRAYITLKKKFAPWFSSRVTSDITYDSAGSDGWELRLKYAYGKFDFKKFLGTSARLESEFGLVHTASDNYDASLWPYRAQGKHFLDRHSIMAAADYGLNVHISFREMDEDWKKRVSNKMAARYGIWLGVYNGAGYTTQEQNDDKAVEALIYVRPFDKTDFLKGFRFGYHILRGESDNLFAGGPTEYPDWEVNQLMASYQREYYTIMFQYYTGQAEDRSSDRNDRDGYNIAGFLRAPFHRQLRAFARYDVYDDNSNRGNYDEETMIYGVSYDLVKGVMAWAAVERKDYESGLESSHTDYKMCQLGLAISF